MIGVFCGEVFFGGEEDLGAVGCHANIVDVVPGGDVVGDGVIDAHVELAGLQGAAGGPGLEPQGGSGQVVTAGARDTGGDEDVGAVGGDGGDAEGVFGVIGGLGGNGLTGGELGGDKDGAGGDLVVVDGAGSGELAFAGRRRRLGGEDKVGEVSGGRDFAGADVVRRPSGDGQVGQSRAWGRRRWGRDWSAGVRGKRLRPEEVGGVGGDGVGVPRSLKAPTPWLPSLNSRKSAMAGSVKTSFWILPGPATPEAGRGARQESMRP